MALGLVKSEVFEEELAKLTSRLAAPEAKIIDIKHGRGNKPAVPESLREVIAGEVICGADVNEVAEIFQVSKSSISAYKHNATSTASYNQPDTRLKRANEKLTGELVGTAQSKMRDALNSIVFPHDIKPNLASAVARDMSSIVKNLNPTPDVQINNQQVIVYKPRMREEDSYEIIQVVE